jgi:hypothetical protein
MLVLPNIIQNYTETVKNAVFWDVKPCEIIVHRRFGGMCRLLRLAGITVEIFLPASTRVPRVEVEILTSGFAKTLRPREPWSLL